jgi:hypothetical protein
MKCINNPALLAGGYGISVASIVTRATQRSKKLITTKPLSDSPRFMVDVLALGFLAPLANWVEGQIGLFNLCILLVFTLALGGCIPQPSAALEALRSFQWGF